MSEPTALHDALPQKGAVIRTTRPFTFWTHEGRFERPAGTQGVVTSASEAAVWARIVGYEMEMLPGEYEVVADA